MADNVQQIKDRLSIVDVISPYVKLMKAGANYKARCPFHSERTPSFIVSPARGTYHCFGCGVGGDMFSFVQEIEGLDFRGALRVLAERAGVTLTSEPRENKDEKEKLFAVMEEAVRYFEGNLQKYPSATQYLHTRGLSDSTIKAFRIGWVPNEWHSLTAYLKAKGYDEKLIEQAGFGKRTPKGMYDRFRSRIMFPINDSAGRCVAFSGRHFVPEGARAAAAGEQEPPKYLNSPETPLFHKSRILYGYDKAKLAIRKYDCTVLVEGQMDLVMAHQALWTNTVAVSGTALTEEHVALIHRMSDNLIISLDADEAGIRAAAKSARIALAAGMDVKVAALPEGQDPADLIKEQGKDAWAHAMKESVYIISFLISILEKTQKNENAFKRAVESSVVPFVAAIKSPMNRDYFIHEISGRTGMVEETVRKSVERSLQNQQNEKSLDIPKIEQTHTQGPVSNVRPRQLVGVYLWQQSLEKPAVDLEELEKRIKQATGQDEVVSKELSELEKESMRFAAEGLYGGSGNVSADINQLVHEVHLARLRQELVAATEALRKAEWSRDEGGVEEALARCQLLTGAIAQIGKVR